MKKLFISTISALLLLLCLPLSAEAHPVPDLSRKGSITITMTYNGEAVPGGTLALYRVGIVQENDGNYTFEPVTALQSVITKFGDIQSRKLAETLAKVVAEKEKMKEISADRTADIGRCGIAKFCGLEPALYLVVQKKAASGYSCISPFLVSVPYFHEDAYIYDVTSDPKTGLEQHPTPLSGCDRLAQTGQLWWPVPLLVCGGLVCVAVGLIRRRRGQNES